MRRREFDAINVTVPHKEAVIPFLDEMDEIATRIGAVNTIVNRNGKLYGYNTDFGGLSSLVERSGIVLTDKTVLILGSGGTSKTALAVAEHFHCTRAVRVSRTGREGCITYEQATEEYQNAHIIINTTPCGMYPNNEETCVDLSLFPALEGVIDVVYNPLRTRLVCDALERGIKAVGGLYMLVAQAVLANALFTGQNENRYSAEQIYHQMCAERENIVLIGMPGSGKTTLGRRLADSLKRPFVDIDALIEEAHGCSVSSFLKDVGEKEFRLAEADKIGEIAHRSGCVIATGGGAILRPENMQRLKQNGRIYFLDRSLDLLEISDHRPLASTREDMRRRFDERYALYVDSCDVQIDADGSPEEVEELIREDVRDEHFGDQWP